MEIPAAVLVPLGCEKDARALIFYKLTEDSATEDSAAGINGPSQFSAFPPFTPAASQEVVMDLPPQSIDANTPVATQPEREDWQLEEDSQSSAFDSETEESLP